MQLLDEVDDLFGMFRHWLHGVAVALPSRRATALRCAANEPLRNLHAPMDDALAALRAAHGLSR
ncbi:MAG TPA: hypothetical protein VND80_11590 [Steroidobacteraceae bacterium]|nr:hypothetical protein [Steroidobacteraceae bacterium]